MNRLSDKQILAVIRRVIRSRTSNAPKEITLETSINDLIYVPKGKISDEYKNLPTAYHIVEDIVGKMINSKSKWVYTPDFHYDETYKNVFTVGDILKIVNEGYEFMAQNANPNNGEKAQREAMKAALANVAMPELDELLSEDLPWERVQKFYVNDGEFHEEYYSVQCIKKYLRSEEDKATMNEYDFSIEDMLNGRVAGEEAQEECDKIFKRWNEKLGFPCYGY